VAPPPGGQNPFTACEGIKKLRRPASGHPPAAKGLAEADRPGDLGGCLHSPASLPLSCGHVSEQIPLPTIRVLSALVLSTIEIEPKDPKDTRSTLNLRSPIAPSGLKLLWGVTVFCCGSGPADGRAHGPAAVVLLLSAGLVIGRSGLGLVQPLFSWAAASKPVVGLAGQPGAFFDGGLKASNLPQQVARLAVLRIRAGFALAAGPALRPAGGPLAGGAETAVGRGVQRRSCWHRPHGVTPLVQQICACAAPRERCLKAKAWYSKTIRGPSWRAVAGAGYRWSGRREGNSVDLG